MPSYVPWIALVFLLALFVLWLYRPRRRRHHRAVSGLLTMSKQLNVGDTDTATVAYTDKAGNAVSLPAGNVPAWTVDDETIATVAPAADGMTAVVTAVAVGTANITVVAEGDASPGVDTITLSGQVSVVDEASGGTLTFA
jgi:uncharacterized protein YjdB